METSYHCSPIELKIKAASLAAEARIIRRLELRLKRRKILSKSVDNNGVTVIKYGPSGLTIGRNADKKAETFFNIQKHRRQDVRIEARATHLARMFLRGRSYRQVEAKAYTFPPMEKAKSIAERHGKFPKGSNSFATEWKAWQDKALTYYTMTD